MPCIACSFHSAVSDMTGVGAELFGSATYWLGAVLLAPGIALLPDLVYLAFQKLLRPTIVDLLQVRHSCRHIWYSSATAVSCNMSCAV